MVQFLLFGTLIYASLANLAVVVDEAASLLQPVVPATETLLQTFVGEDVKEELDVDAMVKAAPSPAPSHQMMDKKTIDLMRSEAYSSYTAAAKFFAWEAMKRTEFHLLAANLSDPSTMKTGFQVAIKAFTQLQSSADQLQGQASRFTAYKEVADAEGLPLNETKLELMTQLKIARDEMHTLIMSKTRALNERYVAEAALSDLQAQNTTTPAGSLQAQKMIDHMQSEAMKSEAAAVDFMMWESTKGSEFEQLAAKFSDPNTMRIGFQVATKAAKKAFSQLVEASNAVFTQMWAFSGFEKGAKGVPSDAEGRQSLFTKAKYEVEYLTKVLGDAVAKADAAKAALSLGPFYAHYFSGLPKALQVKDVNGTRPPSA